MAQCHGTVTVMYRLCIGVCVHLFQTTALHEGTTAEHRVCHGLVDFGNSAPVWYKVEHDIFEIIKSGYTVLSSQQDPSS